MPFADGDVEVRVPEVCGGHEIPLVKRGHHRANGFHLEPSQKAFKGLEVQEPANPVLLGNHETVGVETLKLFQFLGPAQSLPDAVGSATSHTEGIGGKKKRLEEKIFFLVKGNEIRSCNWMPPDCGPAN